MGALASSCYSQSHPNHTPYTSTPHRLTSTQCSIQDISPVYEREERWNLSQPTQETLLQIIRCFPFPTPVPSSSNSPIQHRNNKALQRSKSLNNNKQLTKMISRSKTERDYTRGALSKLAQVSVDTMAITALPLDCWLKERLKSWVQLSGHEGSIVPASEESLWKRKAHSDVTEADAYRNLMLDTALQGFVPRFYREIDYKQESFIEIQDLTASFSNPAIMDIKMGTRTFSECDVANCSKRSDLYEKMLALSPCEPTAEEHSQKAISKLRYMQFREQESSTASLGFRIEAAKMPCGVLQKSFKKVRTRDEVLETLRLFCGQRVGIVAMQLLVRLQALRKAIQQSQFFKHHEVVGSSLLLVYDETQASAWMIDFAKSTPLPACVLQHSITWQPGNHEDGYLIGLDHLITVMQDLTER